MHPGPDLCIAVNCWHFFLGNRIFIDGLPVSIYNQDSYKPKSHLLCWNHLLPFAAEQYKWLERDLAGVNRDVTPWLVATWHPPWYSTYTAHYREAECMRVAMEDLLYDYGIDIVFNGHVSLFYLPQE